MELEIKYKKNLPNEGGNKATSLFDDCWIKTPERFLEISMKIRKYKEHNRILDTGESGGYIDSTHIKFLEREINKFLDVLRNGEGGREIENVLKYHNKSINYFGD